MATPRNSTASSARASQPTHVVFEGTGIHSGGRYRATLGRGQNQALQNPADSAALANSIVFRFRHDGDDFEAPAKWTRVSGTSRSTALVLRGAQRRFELKTVEHFLAGAYWFLGLPMNLDLVHAGPFDGEFECVELPVLDGSAIQWLRGIQELWGTEAEPPSRQFWRVIKPFELRAQDRVVRIDPIDSIRTVFQTQVEFHGHWQQSAEFQFDWNRWSDSLEVYANEIAAARTFGFQHEIESLKARSLIRGGALDNAILLDGPRVLNQGGLRLVNELAAHKLLDAVGDFGLLERPILGRVQCVKAGHEMHIRALQEAMKEGCFVLETHSVSAQTG